MRVGLTPTPWIRTLELASRVAAATKGAADEEVARNLEPERLEALGRPDAYFARRRPHPRSRRLEEPLRVVARGSRLDDRGGAVGREEAGQEDARLHLGARHRQLPADSPELAARDSKRRVAVGRLDGRAHLTQRIGDPVERAPRERLVSDELEAPALAGQETRQEAHEGAGVPAVDRPRRLAEAPETDSGDVNTVAVELHLGSERPGRVDRRERVLRDSEPVERALPVRDRAEEHSPVGDGLVARHGDVAGERDGGLDPHSGTAGETITE